MPKIGPGGRSGAARPADRPVDARLKRPHNVPREGTSLREYFRHRVGEGDLLLKRAAVPSPGGMNQWEGCLLIGPEADSRPGKRRIDQGSWCAIRRRAVCSEGEYYATVSAHATFCSKERLSYRQMVRADGTDAADPVGRPTSGRKFGKLSPESPRLGGVEV